MLSSSPCPALVYPAKISQHQEPPWRLAQSFTCAWRGLWAAPALGWGVDKGSPMFLAVCPLQEEAVPCARGECQGCAVEQPFLELGAWGMAWGSRGSAPRCWGAGSCARAARVLGGWMGSAPSRSGAAGEPRARIELEVFVAGIVTWQQARLSRAAGGMEAPRSPAGSTFRGATSMVGTKEEGTGSSRPSRCCCSGRMCRGSSGCRGFLASGISVLASSWSLHNRGLGVVLPLPMEPAEISPSTCRLPPSPASRAVPNIQEFHFQAPACSSCAWEGLRQLLALRGERARLGGDGEEERERMRWGGGEELAGLAQMCSPVGCVLGILVSSTKWVMMPWERGLAIVEGTQGQACVASGVSPCPALL